MKEQEGGDGEVSSSVGGKGQNLKRFGSTTIDTRETSESLQQLKSRQRNERNVSQSSENLDLDLQHLQFQLFLLQVLLLLLKLNNSPTITRRLPPGRKTLPLLRPLKVLIPFSRHLRIDRLSLLLYHLELPLLNLHKLRMSLSKRLVDLPRFEGSLSVTGKTLLTLDNFFIFSFQFYDILFLF